MRKVFNIMEQPQGLYRYVTGYIPSVFSPSQNPQATQDPNQGSQTVNLYNEINSQSVNHVRELKKEHADLENHYDSRRLKEKLDQDETRKIHEREMEEKRERLRKLEHERHRSGLINHSFEMNQAQHSKLFVLLINLDVQPQQICDGVNKVLEVMNQSSNRVMIGLFDNYLKILRKPGQFSNTSPLYPNEIQNMAAPAILKVLKNTAKDMITHEAKEGEVIFIILTSSKDDLSNDKNKTEKALNFFSEEFKLQYYMICRKASTCPKVIQRYEFKYPEIENFSIILNLLLNLDKTQ